MTTQAQTQPAEPTRATETGNGQPEAAGAESCCPPPASLEHAIRDRYAKGAEQLEPGLCCPTAAYDPKYLSILPDEIIEKDYGCGDPSAHAREGDVVIDLGSGAGKVCYILSQKVGPTGRVIGLDFNDTMLALARKYREPLAEKIGYENVTFRKARVQDMALDLDKVAQWLAENPVTSVEQADEYHAFCERLRRDDPLVADQSVDLIVSNCVLNLVRTEQKRQLFAEMHRVLRPGGRVVISDIVCDEDPTEEILNDPHLWSGCIAGAFREDRFLAMFERAGFYGIEMLERQAEPWQTVGGIEFRSVTVRAYKGKEGPCMDHLQAVVYPGPWKQVQDDDGHVLCRGKRMAVCEKTFRLMTDPAGPYAGQVLPIEPQQPVEPDQAEPFHCKSGGVRGPQETKNLKAVPHAPAEASPCCGSGAGNCC